MTCLTRFVGLVLLGAMLYCTMMMSDVSRYGLVFVDWLDNICGVLVCVMLYLSEYEIESLLAYALG